MDVDVDITKWEQFVNTLTDSALDMCLKLLAAVCVYFIGKFIIGRILKGLDKIKAFRTVDTTAREYIITFIKAAMYVVLLVSIVALLGVPMSSVIAVIASAGVAIGMALQGALSNIAGGIMLLIFRPFSVGDYIVAGDEKGFVRKISLVYTELVTFDNRKISIPNGNLMNSTISNETSEDKRRVDMYFDIAASEPVEKVREVIMDAIKKSPYALSDPKPIVQPNASVTDGITYAAWVWAKTPEYYSLFADMIREIPEALKKAGIERPATPVRVETRERTANV